MPDPTTLANHLPALRKELDLWVRDQRLLGQRIQARRALIAAVEFEAKFVTADRLFDAEPLPVALPEPITNGAVPVEAERNERQTGEIVYEVIALAGHPLRQAAIMEVMEAQGTLPDVANPRAAVGAALWYMANKSKIIAKYGTKRERTWGLPKPSPDGPGEASPGASASSDEVPENSGSEAR